MWRCGLEVLRDYPELEDGRGERGSSTFNAVATEIGRSNHAVRRWVDLVKAVGKTEDEWNKYKQLESKRAADHWQRKWLGEDKPKQLDIPPPSIEGIKILHTDAMDGLQTIKDESIDLCCIDPPYNMGKAEWDEYATDGEYLDWVRLWMAEIYRVLRTTGSFYLFGIFPMLRHISRILDGLGFKYRGYVIWDTVQGTGGGLWVNRHEDILFYSKTEEYYSNKEDITIDREKEDIRKYRGKIYDYKNPSNIWRVPCVDNRSSERVNHPTQKPIAIIEMMLRGSCPLSGVVLDPFAGSGTTLISCMRNKRQGIGIEKNEEYINLINWRISQEEHRNANQNSFN